MSDDTRIDLSRLDPEADPARLDRVRLAVSARVAPSLRRRRSREAGLWLQLVDWRRPVLAAASLLGAVSIIVLASPRSTSVPVASAAPATLAEAAGLPTVIANWVESGTLPSNAALLGVQETP